MSVYDSKIYQIHGGVKAVSNQQILSANGSTSAVMCVGPARLNLSGDFGGGTAELWSQLPDESWVAVGSSQFTAASDTIFGFPNFSRNTLKVVLTGATSASLTCWLQSGLGA